MRIKVKLYFKVSFLAEDRFIVVNIISYSEIKKIDFISNLKVLK